MTSAAAENKADSRPPLKTCKMIAGPRHSVVGIRNGETVVLDDHSEIQLQSIFAPQAPFVKDHTDGLEAHLLVDAATQQAASTRDTSRLLFRSNIWPVEAEAAQSLAKLVVGRSVQLFFTSRNRVDRYGSHNAQLFVIDGPERIWVQRRLIKNGFARVDPSEAPGSCIRKLLTAEQTARKRRRGLWKHAPYAVRPAWKTRELLRYVRTFQIVEGRIRSVGDSRGRLYLNFGKRWATDFTATVSKRVRRKLKENGVDLKKLRGKRVQIRGWVEEWNGPAIRISKASQIEVLSRKRKKRQAPYDTIEAKRAIKAHQTKQSVSGI